MAGMTAGDIMNEALKLARMDEVPPDSGIQVPAPDISRLLVCIDCTTAEVLLARELGIDAVLVHHPFGGASRVRSGLFYRRHVDLMVAHGVPEEAAREAVEPRMNALALAGQSANYDQTVAAARALGVGMVNIHGPLDEIGRRMMQECCDQATAAGGATVGDVAAALSRIPELAAAETDVSVVAGSPGSPAGRVAVAHGALTNGGYDVAKTYFEHGVGTVVYIHIDPTSAGLLQRDGGGNLIVTGHIASDWIGINPLLRRLHELGVDTLALSPLAVTA